MKRHFLLAALLVAGVLNGCAPEGNPLALVITGNAKVGSESSCVIQGGQGVSRTTGTLDLLYATNYVFYPTVRSMLQNAEEVSELGVDTGSLDPNGIHLKGVRVWYEIEGLKGQWTTGETTKIPDEVFTPTFGFMMPGGSVTFGVEIIPREVVQALDGDTAFDALYSGGYLIAHVAVEGTTQDGRKIRSAELAYPIQVCRGCLLYWPVEDPGTCCDGISSTDVIVCSPGQDEAIPCDVGCAMVEFDPRVAEKQAMIMKKSTTLAVTPDDGGDEGDVVESDVAEEDI